MLCEKPLGRTTAEAEQAARACREHGVLLGVGYMMRFHHLHRELEAMVRRGDLGQVIFGRAQATTWYPEIPGAWRQDPALGGGGALPDMGSHCIDLLEQFLGPVAAVKAYVDTLTFRYAVDDSATLLLKHASGAHGVVDVRFNAPDAAARNALEVHGTRGQRLRPPHHRPGRRRDDGLPARSRRLRRRPAPRPRRPFDRLRTAPASRRGAVQRIGGGRCRRNR